MKRLLVFLPFLFLAGGAGLVLTSCAPRKQAAATLYHCPMHPTVTSDRPGSCNICGMDLVLVDAAGHDAAPTPDAHGEHAVPGRTAIGVNTELRQRIGVTYANAQTKRFRVTVRTTGAVAWDENRRWSAAARVSGFVTRLHVRAVGDRVTKGQAIAEIYAPELAQAAAEYQAALRTAAALQAGGEDTQATAKQLVASAATRLSRLGLSRAEISRIGTGGEPPTRISIFAPETGVLMERMVNEGDQVMAGMPVAVIVDASTVWVLADGYEKDLPDLREGLKVEITPKGGGPAFAGTIAYIQPELDMMTRTAKLRIVVPNPDGALRPGMYADVTIETAARETLSVPETAVLRSGERDYVFVVGADDHFTPRTVRLGVSEAGNVEVLEGLTDGERVVKSAAFLLDSDSSLKAALASQNGSSGPAPAEAGGAPADPHAGHAR